MSQAIAEILALAFFFLLAVFFLGIVIAKMTDDKSSPPKLTQIQAKNKAKRVIWRTNAYLLKRKVFRSIKFWSN